jgi:uncharacterized protein
MIIKVSEIPEEGLRLEGPEAFPQPFQDRSWRLEDVGLGVEKDGDTVFVTGHLRSRVPQVCSRCLESYEATVDADVDTRLVPAPAARGEERELGADDLETDVYDPDQIDLNALIETETTLGLPMKPLCREECRGLCPSCGASRNGAPCSCAPAVDPRWSPLKGLAERLSKSST